jgi:K+-sensing histidine kinase KdpD
MKPGRDDSERLFYMSAGPLAALVLGVGLVPLRGVTHASNFTFAFLVVIIVAAELGGRGPGVATALASVLSLDFFLTEPYLKLSIAAKDDVIAFVGLGVCGLVAAALGSRRRGDPEPEWVPREHLDLLHRAIGELETTPPLEPVLVRVLHAAQAALPLSAAVVRDAQGDVVASVDHARRAQSGPPPLLLDLPLGVFPDGGARMALAPTGRTVGFLDVWGDGRPWTAEHRLMLRSLAALLGLSLQGRRGGPP